MPIESNRENAKIYPMGVQEVKERIASMSAAELADVEAYIHGLKCDRSRPAPLARQSISFEEAAQHVRTDYAHLLHKLSQ